MRRTPETGSEPALHAALRRPEVPATELAEDQPTAGFEDAHHLPDRPARIVDETERGDRYDAIELPCGEWKVDGIPFDQIDLDACSPRPAVHGG